MIPSLTGLVETQLSSRSSCELEERETQAISVNDPKKPRKGDSHPVFTPDTLQLITLRDILEKLDPKIVRNACLDHLQNEVLLRISDKDGGFNMKLYNTERESVAIPLQLVTHSMTTNRVEFHTPKNFIPQREKSSNYRSAEEVPGVEFNFMSTKKVVWDHNETSWGRNLRFANWNDEDLTVELDEPPWFPHRIEVFRGSADPPIGNWTVQVFVDVYMDTKPINDKLCALMRGSQAHNGDHRAIVAAGDKILLTELGEIESVEVYVYRREG